MGTRPFPKAAAIRAAMAALLAGGATALAPAAAAQSASADGTAQVILLRPLSFFIVDELHFGDIVPNPTAAGTVRLQPNGARTATNGIVLVGNTHQPSRFAGLGRRNQQVAISVSANAILLTGPGPSMRVHSFEIGSSPTAILSTAPLRFRITSATGAFNFPVGAILDVGAGQPEGEYSGTYSITLNYI
ncbi:MAG: DUF4402 domain-containing protein [Sphingopyxis sp.]|nr:DUF4402 domain-containing protein [Sphingopyxis sp.]